MPERYQLIRIDKRGYAWSWHKDLPYKPIREMCWDDAKNNFCEPNFNPTLFLWISMLIDWETGKHGNIYQNKRGNCYIWWWHPQYGSDKNPHIEKAEWIDFAG